MKKTLKVAGLVLAMGVSAQLVGCASMQTAIEKRNLDVQSKMSDTVFLSPVSPHEKTVFVQMRNTSDKDIDMQGLQAKLDKALESRGYSVVNDPDKATFMVQENVLSIGKVNKEDAYGAVADGFGGAAAGAAIGGLTSNGTYTDTGNRSLVGGLIGAGVGMAAHALVKDVYFNIVTDLQIKQKAKAGQVVKQVQTTNAQSGSSSNTQQTIVGTSNWVTYRTRIVSVANKVNLDFKEAKPVLEEQLVKTTAGIF